MMYSPAAFMVVHQQKARKNMSLSARSISVPSLNERCKEYNYIQVSTYLVGIVL